MPVWVWLMLAASLAAQITWQAGPSRPSPSKQALPPPPTAQALRLASFGEPEAASRLALLYLQGFGLPGLDYLRLIGWLEALLQLDARSGYPLFLAAQLYAEHPDPRRSRAMLEFIYRAYLQDPNRRWPWLAHAALVAKHRLKDLPLARRYAAAVDAHATGKDVPSWARQMEIFILEDMNELEAAKILLGGLLARGAIADPNELRFLQQRLEELEARLAAGQ